MSDCISTRLFVLSDTHGDDLQVPNNLEVDVAIHCGDLTEESKLTEFVSCVKLLKQIKAPLKLVIAGNHDFTLDDQTFKAKLKAIKPPLEQSLVDREYGQFGQARRLLDTAGGGIVFLDEDTHEFVLQNGGRLRVYASPFTPGTSECAFQFSQDEGHDWGIEDADIVITHGPPRGLLDYTDSKQRAGCQSLFAAVARCRPKLHCFGHIHEGWGAKLVTWRETPSADPHHFTDIDNDKSMLIESLATLRPGKFDSPEDANAKRAKLDVLLKRGYCEAREAVCTGERTLFVNAAIQGRDEELPQLPWLVCVDLPTADRIAPNPVDRGKIQVDVLVKAGSG